MQSLNHRGNRWAIPFMVGAVFLVQAARAQDSSDWVQTARAAAQGSPGFDSFIGLGLAQGRAGQHEQAIESYRRAVAVSPKSAIAYNNICSEYNILGRWREARRNCEKALELQPGFVLAKNNLDYTLKQISGETDRSKLLEKNIRSGKQVNESRFELGMIHYNRAEYAAAIRAWEKIPDSSPIYATTQNNIASAGILMKDFARAKSAIDRALAREPKNPLFQNNARWWEQASSSASSSAAKAESQKHERSDH